MLATNVDGPPHASYLFGICDINKFKDTHETYKQWHECYGPAVSIPLPLGNKRIMLLDPKAIVSMLNRDTYQYEHRPLMKVLVKRLVSLEVTLNHMLTAHPFRLDGPEYAIHRR